MAARFPTMRAIRITLVAAGAIGCCDLAGCQPGPADYAAAAQAHRQQAANDAAIARQNATAADVLGRRGDEQGKAIAASAARENARAAEEERGHANKDQWLSTWWP